MRPIDIVRRAQQTSILGAADGEMPYLDLGASPRPPYDLNAPGAITELKTTLRALASSSALQGAPADEQRYQAMRDDAGGVETWDPASADELVLCFGRIRSLQWVAVAGISEPWWTVTPVGPQPTATGLEMIAGASYLYRLGAMPMYLAWRGGFLSPPSRVSGPSPSDPVVPASIFGPDFHYEPADAPEPYKSALATADSNLLGYWTEASEAADGPSRVALAAAIVTARQVRDGIIAQALPLIPPRQGTTVVEHVDEEACEKTGGSWQDGECKTKTTSSAWLWLIGIPVGVAGVYYLTRKKR